ncbi:ABC transporter permease [Conexibacter sp. JD483]|uniref:ABC transporter permease n=1 Tax=unclassified Conexibacter TaxID=2627773 RepID=UPI00271A1E0E|nr:MULTISPECIES: ABC transporter permease [unclassified Conexibacter]MDO8187835.1 ABC transporter permease [Conexibacter sp. CPCC 205706]MDO8199956.1 ABC transporter permease [Conexibacter sp. CPCC 205762]MDR9369483.1 ABC transporter permease [Conexibacter sp. JD483]
MSEHLTASAQSAAVDGSVQTGGTGGQPDPAPAGRATAASSPVRDAAAAFAARYGLLVAFLATVVVFSAVRSSTFPTWRNAESILTLAAPSLIIAVGLTVVLVMQDFDLSFGGMIGLAGGAATAFMVNHGWAWQLAVVVVIGLGVLVGVLNGFMVAYLGGNSFIITLAMGTVLAGVEFGLTDQATVYDGIPAGYVQIASGELLGLSNQIWIAAVLAIVVWVLLERSEIGRFMYAIGGNPEAARLSGVRVLRLRLLGFVVVGVAAAVVGILLTSQSASYAPNGGTAYLLPAFAAVFLGAAVFRPGEFNVLGTIVGVLFLGVIQTGLTMLDLETWVINLVQGGILITAVLVSRMGMARR